MHLHDRGGVHGGQRGARCHLVREGWRERKSRAVNKNQALILVRSSAAAAAAGFVGQSDAEEGDV